MNSLLEQIKRCKKGDNESLEYLIKRFDPIINSLAYKSKNEYEKSDLTIFLIKLIKNIDLINLNNVSDGGLIKYIEKSLKREFFKINKKSIFVEVELDDRFNENTYEYTDIEFKILLSELRKNKIINAKQLYIFLNKYYFMKDEKEIANELGISRQAVNKTNKTAIQRVKKYLLEERKCI